MGGKAVLFGVALSPALRVPSAFCDTGDHMRCSYRFPESKDHFRGIAQAILNNDWQNE